MRQLEYLVAIAEHGHVGQAAKTCFVTQPSLSAQIKELERQLGTAVVEHVGRGIAVTPLGNELAKRARRILREADDLVELANLSNEGLVGVVRLAAIPTVAPYLLPLVLPPMRERHQGAAFHLRELQTPHLIEALDAREIDIGIMALPVENPDFDYTVILDDPFLLAVDPVHKFALATGVPIDSLRGQEVLLLEDGHCLRDQALAICDQVGAQDRGRIQGTSLATLCQMVAAGMGITLLPQSAAAVEARDGAGIVVRPFIGTSPSRQLVLVWRKRSPSASLYHALAATMYSVLSEQV